MKIIKIGQSATKPIEIWEGSTTIIGTWKHEGIVYSLNKYRETEGIKDLSDDGTWNEGRTKDILNRVKHL